MRRPTSAGSPTCRTCTPTSARAASHPVTILQSYEQGVTVWGEQGMAALWGAATKKIIGAGVDSPRLARDLATLIGQHDVPVRSINYGEGRASESVSLRRQDILEPAAIRALPPGTALLLATGIKPALIHLTPWHAGPAPHRSAPPRLRPRTRSAPPRTRPGRPSLTTGARPPPHRRRHRHDQHHHRPGGTGAPAPCRQRPPPPPCRQATAATAAAEALANRRLSRNSPNWKTG